MLLSVGAAAAVVAVLLAGCAGSILKLEAQGCYQLLMVVQGQLPLSGVELDAEQAAFLPAGQDYQLASADPSAGLVLLLARPRG